MKNRAGKQADYQLSPAISLCGSMREYAESTCLHARFFVLHPSSLFIKNVAVWLK